MAGCSVASSLPGLGTTTTVSTTMPPSFGQLAAVGDAYEVRLGSVGTAPFRSLVTPLPIGSASTYEVILRSGDAEIRGRVEVVVTASAADGSAESLELELVELSMTDIPASELEPALGASLRLDRDAARIPTSVERVVPDGLSRRAGLAAASVLDGFEVGVVPLPAPGVGDGAGWTVRRTTADGAIAESMVSATVTDIDGVTVTEVRHPVDVSGGLLVSDGVVATWWLDGGGPFGHSARIEFGDATVELVRR